MTDATRSSHKQFEIGVKAIIIRGRRLLLLRRQDFDTWDMPGGRINMGEDTFAALRRELSEELLASLTFITFAEYCQEAEFTLPNGNHLMLLFFTVCVDLPKKIILSPEHTEVRWASLADLNNMRMQPAIRCAAENAMSNHKTTSSKKL